MKKIYCILVVLLVVNQVIAQSDHPCLSCFPDGLTLNSQYGIDNFQTLFPNCTEIEGWLKICDDGIINLNGLSVLNSVVGNITIEHTSLTNLTGLENLTAINQNIYIDGNNTLTSLTGLNNVTSIGSYLWIQDCNALTGLTGLENITSIGALHIDDNPALNSLTGLDNLISIGGSLEILFNDSLSNLTGLNNLNFIGTVISIGGNNALTSLTGLENINSIGMSLGINSNDNLTNLIGLGNLTTIGANLNIGSNLSLTSLTGLDNLISIGGGVMITDNYVLTSLTGLGNLASIGGVLALFYNYELTNLTGLNNIEGGSINSLYIVDNTLLSTCAVQSICDYLASPNGTTDIRGNATGCNNIEAVKEACGLTSVETLISGSSIMIYPNPALNTITIESNAKGILSFLNLQNQEVLQLEITEPISIIDVSGMKSGVYIFRLTNDRTVQMGKFIKQ